MALPLNIDDLINAKTVESVRIEFKQGWNPYSILKTVCAFANDIDEYGGGYVIVGIGEQDGSPVLPPSGIEQKDLDNIQRDFFKLCQDNLKENIFPIIEPVLFQGKWILVIWVTTGEQRPYKASDSPGKNAQMKIFVRHGAITKEATREQEIRLGELSIYKHYDDRINPRATIDDLDLGLMLTYLQEVKSQLYKEAQGMSLVDLCLKMQIARGAAENIRPLNVGLLLFCKNPENFFPGCVTNLVEFEDDAGTKYAEKQFSGPVHFQIRQIMDYFNSTILKQYVRKEQKVAETTKFFNYPYQAIEETVVNSLYHRSYENPTPNEIRVYRNGANRRIEVLSYPGPLPPIDENALLQLKVTARNYRNLKLGDWLKNLRLAEKYATGIPTIVDSLNRNGSPKPILSTDEAKTHFLVVVNTHPDTPIESENTATELEIISLSDLQQKILEQLVKEPSTQNEIKGHLHINTKAELDYLLGKGLVKAKKSGKSTMYFITPEGRESLNNNF
ncbi:MAG: putative DNA binding domain-containing protein [Sphingobacteriales bacterium]|nr:putative DNA binding domain-containing protein [Sphingobacteriales bacterium]OJW01782.1 MAG: hypothetical protein BGO52_15030 [Sphingobacteriales bacterium 44-61]